MCRTQYLGKGRAICHEDADRSPQLRSFVKMATAIELLRPRRRRLVPPTPSRRWLSRPCAGPVGARKCHLGTYSRSVGLTLRLKTVRYFCPAPAARQRNAFQGPVRRPLIATATSRPYDLPLRQQAPISTSRDEHPRALAELIDAPWWRFRAERGILQHMRHELGLTMSAPHRLWPIPIS